jgi:hypothetical protein
MKKILIITLLATLLVSCQTKNNDEDNTSKLENKPQIHTVLKPKSAEEKYGKLAKFIKSDLSLKEDKELLSILENRKKTVKEI